MFPLPHNPSKGTVGTSPAVEKAQFREFGSQVFLLQPQPPPPQDFIGITQWSNPFSKNKDLGTVDVDQAFVFQLNLRFSKAMYPHSQFAFAVKTYLHYFDGRTEWLVEP